MYDYLIVTHIPAFYKVNLYNELVKKLNILVVFVASNTSEKRADDFITLGNAKFKYEVLFDGNFQDRDILKNIKELNQISKQRKYKKLIVSGWDLKEFWYLIFTNAKSKNCLALESSINESRIDGIRGLVKRIFLSRISSVFASGKLHVELLNALNYKDDIKITKGVGIINKPILKTITKEYKKRFLFIGRLSNVKNITMLVEVFNNLPEHTLTVIGIGPLEKELKKIANKNINFIGQVENSKLKEYFLQNNIFILPSISEPWGLVVEEALYFGMPVIISGNCGSSELIKNDINGYVIKSIEKNDIKKVILNIDTDVYKTLEDGVEKCSIELKDYTQVNCYEL